MNKQFFFYQVFFKAVLNPCYKTNLTKLKINKLITVYVLILICKLVKY